MSAVASACWLVFLILSPLAGLRVSRPRFELAAIAFGAILLLSVIQRAWLTRDPSQTPALAPPPRAPAPVTFTLALLLPALAGLIAFGWTLGLGPLADDYVMHAWAANGQLLPADWMYVRPVPLFIWWIVLHLGATWPVLHALNVICHCTTAALLGLIASRLFNSAGTSVAAGVLFALFPASIEAAGWTAGIFDALMTLCLVAAAGIFLFSHHESRDRAALTGLTLIALLTKETAVVAPLLLLSLVPLARRATRISTKRLLVSVLMIGVLVTLYLAMRSPSVGIAFADILPHTRWQIKDLLIRPYAALISPFHERTSNDLPIIAALAILVMLVAAVAPREHERERKTSPNVAFLTVIAGLGWITLSALPPLREFYVGPDLQGSRFAYLSVAGFSLVLTGSLDACLAAGGRARWPGLVGLLAPIALITTWLVALPTHRAPWQTAASIRDALLRDAQRLIDQNQCSTLHVQGSPESIGGAFVFSQGLPQALSELHYRRDGRECLAAWTVDSLIGR